MAKKQEVEIKEVIREVEVIKEVVKLPENVEIVKQKLLNHLHGKEKADLQELFNLL